MNKYRKQLHREISAVRKQLKRLTYVSIAITLVITGSAVAAACGAASTVV